MPVSAERFGTTPDGEEVDRYTLAAGPIRIQVLSYGGALCAIEAPDRAGRTANVVLGLPTLDDYVHRSPYFGCITGRYANRIAGGRFTLDGRSYHIPLNDGPNALHGGGIGLDKQVWKVEETGDAAIRLHHTSPDGDQGFPGTLAVSVSYTLGERGDLRIDYAATCDAPTVLNLTNHSYFNLAGEGSGDVYGHVVQINADGYTPVGPDLIPTGVIEPVAGTPLDFTTPTEVRARIRDDFPQLVRGHGYDHNYVLRGAQVAARVVEPVSGRTLSVQTTEPGMQFYTGNFLDGALVGPAGRAYRQGDGLALETQHFPDSPNQPSFPSTVLRPGQEFRSTTVYTFGVE
ncbi:galactose mutarotase [Rugosimonospora acidiphila]|uniref:Aldose 1-epimerase n=1 Tax=Rugosimonospora acidiphila TaxID=556531 RepID=A0ABP9S550_9ACTN